MVRTNIVFCCGLVLASLAIAWLAFPYAAMSP